MEKKTENKLTVRCPKCGHEYHLCELAMPGELLGTPKKHGIIKDPVGKILYLDWEEAPVNTFTYCCDNCEREFTVEVKISLSVKEPAPEEDFSTLETSLF